MPTTPSPAVRDLVAVRGPAYSGRTARVESVEDDELIIRFTDHHTTLLVTVDEVAVLPAGTRPHSKGMPGSPEALAAFPPAPLPAGPSGPGEAMRGGFAVGPGGRGY